jgi:S-adenosylhomocysteine hydrolase
MNNTTTQQYQAFFSQLLKNSKHKSTKSTAICVVIHAFENIFPFLEILNKHFYLYAVIFKGSKEVHLDVIKQAKSKGLAVRDDISREDLLNESVIEQFFKPLTNQSSLKNLVLLDYGGYFKQAYSYLTVHPQLKDKFKGIIEGTENGHQRYQDFLQANQESVPVISIARGLSKGTYDAHIGKSIVDGCQFTLSRSELDCSLSVHKTIGIIGYGKIGRSTAFFIRLSVPNAKILVCERNPSREQQATKDGFNTTSLENLLAQSSLILSITGNQAIKPHHFDSLAEHNKIIACGTSPDDELNLETLLEQKVLRGGISRNAHVLNKKYKTRKGKTVNLLGNGRTINTMLRQGAHHASLALTEGCFLIQIFYLLTLKHAGIIGAPILPTPAQEQMVFSAWIKCFVKHAQIGEHVQVELLSEPAVAMLSYAQKQFSCRPWCALSNKGNAENPSYLS